MKEFSDYGIEIPGGRTSGKVKTFCPRCHEGRHNLRDKSLSVDVGKGIWKCHHCDWTGYLEYTDEEKARWCQRQRMLKGSQPMSPVGAKSTSAQSRKEVSRKEYVLPQCGAGEELSASVLAWFGSRGIGQATLATAGVTEDNEWMPQTGKIEHTIRFNYLREGALVNVKYRTGAKYFKMVSGAELIPYNIDGIKGSRECIITEGEMDALSFMEIGRNDVVSVPNGANVNLEYLDSVFEPYFEDKEVIYIASDTDTKGVQLRDELVRRFGAERCRIVEYGEGCKDANECLVAHGAEGLRACLLSAREPMLEGVCSVDDFEERLDAIYRDGLRPGVTLGLGELDEMISFETGRVCLVTGYPGSGKSEFIDEMAERLNVRYGWRFGFFSPENQPVELHASKLIEKFVGKRFGSASTSSREYDMAKERLRRDFFFINPENNRLDTILECGRKLVRRRGIRCLVIDPFNRIEDERTGLRETDYVSVVMDKLSDFARRNDVLVIMMAHPAKPLRSRDGSLEAPTLYDISGSAHFFNKTDFGIVIFRNHTERLVEVHVEKVKFRHLGAPGEVKMLYNENNGRYVCVDNDVEIPWDNTNHLCAGAKLRAVTDETTAAATQGSLFETSEGEVPF